MEFAFLGPQTPRGWEAWDGQNVEVTDQGVSLAMERTYLPPELVIDEPPSEFTVVDIDIDSCGNLWILTQEGEIYHFDLKREKLRQSSCLWHDEDQFTNPRALGITDQNIYTADGEAGTVQAFSRPLEQTRRISDTPYQKPIAFATICELTYVLDQGTGTGNGFVARIHDDRTEDVWSGLVSPRDITIDPTGILYVLDMRGTDTDPEPVIVAFDPTEMEAGERVVVPPEHFRVHGQSETLSPSCLEVGDGTGIFVGVDVGGGGLFEYRPDEEMFEPVSVFQEPCFGILARQETNCAVTGFYVIDGERRIRVLEETRRYTQNECSSRFDANIIGRVDSGEQRTQWHRLAVNASRGEADTQIRLSYAATADPRRTEALTQISGIGTEYAKRLRDAGVCHVSSLARLTTQEAASLSGAPVTRVETDGWIGQASERRIDWQEVGSPDPEDALFHGAEGRYLWLKIELLGTPRSSPHVHSMRAYFPRTTYLRYLPAIYQKNERSKAFLERFLSVFESVFTDVEEEIDGITRYLDPYGVPPEFLSWLGAWLAIATEDLWPTSARRELILNAPSLFKKRGTRAGLLRILRIYLAHTATASDSAWPAERSLKYGVASHDGWSAEPLYLLEYEDFDCIDVMDAKKTYRKIVPCPQCFLVLVRASLTDEQTRAIRRIVETQKPAHTLGTAVELRPEIRLGENSYLGINSTLSPQEFTVERATLGRGTVLTERETSGQLGLKSRLDEDATIS